MQSYGNCKTKPESKCSGKQNTPPQKSEAGSLTKMYGGSCIGVLLQKEGKRYKKKQLLLPILPSLTHRSRRVFPENAPHCDLNLDDVIFRLVVTISGCSPRRTRVSFWISAGITIAHRNRYAAARRVAHRRPRRQRWIDLRSPEELQFC